MPPVPATLQPLVLEELERLTASDTLSRSPQLVRLLRHLVVRHLAGEATALREAAIALEVFRRDPSTYDAQADPIVRVTTGRLRDRLDAHYADGGSHPLRIVLPKGRYVPEYVTARPAPHAPLGVAVLAARNTTGDTRHDGFCIAFADRLADALARAGVDRVAARTSVERAAKRNDSFAAIAADLDAAWLLDASLAVDAGDAVAASLRLSVRLVDGRDATVRWTLGRALGAGNGHATGDRLIDAVVMRAVETLPGSRSAAVVASPSALPAEQRNAVDAARLLLLQRSLAATEEAIALADQVVSCFPQAAGGWATLAAALYSRMTFQDRDVAPLAQRARDAADRALAIDAGEPVALRTKAIIVGRREWKADEGIALFERALRSAPHYTSARLNLAELALLQGDFDRALAEANLALVYDPLSPSVRLCRALVLAMLARYAEARAEWAILRASGEASFWTLTGPARLEAMAGQFDAAHALAQQARQRFPDLPDPLFVHAYVAAARGQAKLALRLDAELASRFPHASPTQRSMIAARLRDKDRVLARLDEALAVRDLGFLYASVAPDFAWLADDGDFLRRLAAAGVRGWRGRHRAEVATPPV